MVNFALVQKNLDLVVSSAGADAALAPHRRFWSSYEALATEPLPSVKCQGAAISAIKWLDAARTRADPDNSPLYLILTSQNGFCSREQMPPGGPFIVDPGYTVSLDDGTIVTGQAIVRDIHDWIAAGAPES